MQADAEIVQAVLKGDREAFAELVARHERAVWATAWRILRDDHAAADAGQEAFLQAFRRLDGLRRPEFFGVWVLRIARREAVRLARRRKQDAGPSFDESEVYSLPRSNTSTTCVPADAEELLTAVARLPEHERLVVVLHHLDGRPVSEVAAVLGRPLGTVTKQLSRAIERLRLRTKEVRG